MISTFFWYQSGVNLFKHALWTILSTDKQQVQNVPNDSYYIIVKNTVLVTYWGYLMQIERS